MYATKHYKSSTMANKIGLAHKLSRKTGRDLKAPLIIPTHLQTLQIVMKLLMKTIISQVNNH